jgi:photosystem II stability/assembly factor-like uncharacterized protein
MLYCSVRRIVLVTTVVVLTCVRGNVGKFWVGKVSLRSWRQLALKTLPSSSDISIATDPGQFLSSFSI